MRVRKVDFYDSDGKYSHRADIRFNNDGTAHRGDIKSGCEVTMNTYRKVQPEFKYAKTGKPAVIGTDCIIYVDGRWSKRRADEHITFVAEDYAQSRGLVWTGEMYLVGRKRNVRVTQ